MTHELELMDWKDIERNSANALREAKKSMIVAVTLLNLATTRIKELGGDTDEEIDDKARKQTTE